MRLRGDWVKHAIVPFDERDHDKLVEIWYRAVRGTHTFLSEKDFQFYRRIVQGGALREVEVARELAA